MDGKVRRGFWKYMLPVPGLLLKIGAEKGRKKRAFSTAVRPALKVVPVHVAAAVR